MLTRSTTLLHLLLFAAAAFHLDAADPTGTDVSQVRKVVGQYALTSGNDFQQRDPRDWRLLASNDGGKSWVQLDQRNGEVFTERHQRRVFKIPNASAFNLYRLQIDRVRDPGAFSVQLAEIELMGESPDAVDPTPVAGDRIRAQGENPPVESAAQLFDRRPETKWLDRPPDQSTCASWIEWQYVSASATVITNIQSLQKLRTRARDGYRVRLSAVVTDRDCGPGRIELLDRSGSIEIPVLESQARYIPGQQVTAEGISAWTNQQGTLASAVIRAVGPEPPSSPMKILPDQGMSPDLDFCWVEVEGMVHFLGRSGKAWFFDLKNGESSLRVQVDGVAGAEALKSGDVVRVRGICQAGFNARGEWVPGLVRASRWESLPNPQARRPSGVKRSSETGAPMEFTPIDTVRRWNRAKLDSRPRIIVRGVITSMLGMYLQDETGAIQVVFKPEHAPVVTELGQYMELEGHAGLAIAGTPLISIDRIIRSAKGSLPAPDRPSWSQLTSGRMDAQWIEMHGVVRTTDGAHLLLNCDDRQVTASIGNAPAAVVKELVDAAVRVRGVGLAALDDWGRVQGVHLLIPSMEHVAIDRHPPEPFSQPIQRLREILRLDPTGEALHQVRVEGTMTLQDGRRLFLQDSNGCAMAIFKEDVVLDPKFGNARWSFWRITGTNAPLPPEMQFSPGDRLQVVGFCDPRGYSPVLTEITVRKVGRGTVDVQKVNRASLNNWRLDSALVQVEAVLLTRETLGTHNMLELLWEGRTLPAIIPSHVSQLDKLIPGMRLRVTGVWQMEPVPYPELGRRVASVRILPRSMSDIEILSRPSWWTLQRAVMVIGAMAFVLVAASVWITQLHRKVEQRSVQLSAEIHRREQIERQRALHEERARIAQDLHDDLGAALTQIRFLSAVESRDAAVPEGTRSQLSQVSEKARHLVASLDEIVWAINPANDSLPSLANYLSHVAEEFFASTPIRCRLDIDDALPAVTLTSEVRHNLYLSVREALNNIAKHSGAAEVWLRFRWKDSALVIDIEDNGRGFSAEAMGAGEGLSNMRRRMDRIGGRFECESKPGMGTVYRMRLSLQPGVAAADLPRVADQIHPF